jgi:hypothetical protein
MWYYEPKYYSEVKGSDEMAKKKTAIKVGSTVQVTTTNYTNYGFPVGTVAKVTSGYPGNAGYVYLDNNMSCGVAKAHLEVVTLTFSKESIEKEKADLVARIAALDSKLAFLEETESETGTEQEYRVYATLTLFENGDLTKQQKAKQIAALLEDK